MEENNDFEKFEEYEDSAETLLGTNEKSSSMTSRERVDSAVEDAGSEVLSKVGVPKDLAKKAVKSNGGKLSPTNYGVNKLAKNFTRNKVAKGLDKMDNLKNKSGANKDKTGDRINQSKKRGNLFSKGKTNKSSNESEGTAKESNEKKSGLSKSSDGKKSNGKSKLATAAHIAKNPKKAAIEAGVNLAKMIWEKKKKKIIMGIAIGAAVTFISVIFIFEVIMGPLMDAFKMADNILTETADFAEKLDNFYSGFGFQDSKEAFYDELDSLCDRYGCSNDGTGLDMPLLLATLFYTEGMGYDTQYNQIEGDDAIDASMNANSSNSGIFAAVRKYLGSKFDEAQQTVDENGIVYNSGKIYRLRKLARNQFHTNAFGIATRSGQPTTVSLGTFISKFGSTIGTDLKDILERFSGALFSAMYAPFKELYAFIFGSDYSGSFYEKSGEATSEFAVSIVQLICDIFYGIVDITNIDISLTGGIKISYYDSYVFEEDNYKNYLTKYYFEFMPEYREMLNGLSGDERKEKKEYLYREINDNKKLFESVFLEYQNESTESYTNSCVGAVDQNLISELNMPVDIADNATISFDDNYSYGIVNGKTHNGVDLNEKTVGVKLGANVYSVANGKIESIEDSKCTDDSKKCGKSIKIKHNLVIDNNEYNFFTIYSNVTIKSGLKKGDNVAKGDQIGLIYNNASNIEGLHFVFMDANNDAKGTAIDPTNIFITCSTDSDNWLIHQSSISKSDFSKKLSNYCSNNSCDSSMQMFVNNADLIYDTAKKNNVSPELVVVRAVNEGFSPGNENGSNNYWGIGCTNTGGIGACSSYSSLAEGIKGFANISPVKDSQTATEMMSTYAYIGDYWYNPGSWSIGGCQYYSYINGYMSTNRSMVVGGYCEASRACSGSSCSKTIDEDQKAYSKWQVDDNLIKRRKEIFGY